MTHQSSDPARPLRVLLVDDDEDDYRLTRALLHEIPYTKFHLDWVSSFEAALDAVRDCGHDIYLIDYRLGAKTGLDLLKEMREQNCHTPVILLTGQGEMEVDRAATEAGAADYLEKSRLEAVILERMIRYALRQHAQERELETKVIERTAALETANARLNELDRRKDEFIATLAHELRNPLAPIRNALEIQRMVAGDTAAMEQARGMIERQVHQMVRLIDDLLDASRMTRGKLRLERVPMDLREPLEVAVESSRPLMERSHLNFRNRLPNDAMPIVGDRIRIAQLFTNLLNNASKYTPANGTVTLSAVRDGSMYEVAVIDTGAGIPAELLPTVFDMFTQIDRTLNRSEGGLGIGLALVKQIAEMHGGSVAADSPGINSGSTFTIRLPAA